MISRYYISIFVNGIKERHPYELKPDNWTNIKIIQQEIKGKVLVVIVIDGKQKNCMENNNPRDFNNVHVHVRSPKQLQYP